MEPFEKKGMPEKGISHVIKALGYSMAGARFLAKEEAARIEFYALVGALLFFLLLGASLLQIIGLLGLGLLVLMVEALNTSIELIVDRTSPEQSDYAKHSKDLGSLAVFCSLMMMGLYVAAITVSLIVPLW